jgi:hypothetical protein
MYTIDEPQADEEVARFLLEHSAARPPRDVPMTDGAGLGG